MAALFFDSSALTKGYTQEVGSAWVESLLFPGAGHELIVVRLTMVEVTSALVRHVPVIPAADLAIALAELQPDFQHLFHVLEVSELLIDSASELVVKHRLRAYDGVQLAAAISMHALRTSLGLPNLTLISADHALNQAAQAEGLVVDDPLLHP